MGCQVSGGRRKSELKATDEEQRQIPLKLVLVLAKQIVKALHLMGLEAAQLELMHFAAYWLVFD